MVSVPDTLENAGRRLPAPPGINPSVLVFLISRVKRAASPRRVKFTIVWRAGTDPQANGNLMLRDPLVRFEQCVAREW